MFSLKLKVLKNQQGFTLLELIRALNERQEQHLKLLADIRAASSLADLKERIDKK